MPLKNSSVISNFIIIREIKHWKNRAIHISIPQASNLTGNLTSPLRRIREHGEKLILPSFADFCLSEKIGI